MFGASLRSYFVASLPHVLSAFWPFASLVASFASGVFCNITCPIFYSISCSWPHLAAGGHSWFHRAPQSPTFPKMPEFKNIDL